MSKHVLFILTSHNSLGDTEKQTGFWLSEFVAPYYEFIDAGHRVTITSPAGGYPPVEPKSAELEYQTDATKRFDLDSKILQALQKTVKLNKIQSQDYDAVFYPGGHGLLWDLVNDPLNAQIVSEFCLSEKPVGAVSHGPAALINALNGMLAPVISSKNVTGLSNTEQQVFGTETVVPFLLEDMIKELGGKYQRAEDWQSFVVTDGLIVTGQNPTSAAATAQAVIELLE